MRRLRAQVDLVRGLDHQNLETIFEVGALADDTPYLLTEWIPHPSLAHVLSKRARLPKDLTVDILEGVGDALAALHGLGLAHGDVRPSRLLCHIRTRGFGELKLVDPVMHAALDTVSAGDGARHDGVGGSLAYLAPERIGGGGPSPAADVYALGVLAYRMLRGALPFRADDPRSAHVGHDPVERVCWLHTYASLPGPAIRKPKSLLDVALNALVERSCARPLEHRLPNAGAFVAALDALRSDPEAWLTQSVSPDTAADQLPPLVPAPSLAPTPPPGLEVCDSLFDTGPTWAERFARAPLWQWSAAGLAVGALAGWLV